MEALDPKIGKRLCEALGLGNQKVKRMDISLGPHELITVRAEILVEGFEGFVEVLEAVDIKWKDKNDNEGEEICNPTND